MDRGTEQQMSLKLGKPGWIDNTTTITSAEHWNWNQNLKFSKLKGNWNQDSTSQLLNLKITQDSGTNLDPSCISLEIGTKSNLVWEV